MRKLQLLLLALGSGLFAYLLWKVGASELWRGLAALGWWLIPLLLGEGLAEMLHILLWAAFGLLNQALFASRSTNATLAVAAHVTLFSPGFKHSPDP